MNRKLTRALLGLERVNQRLNSVAAREREEELPRAITARLRETALSVPTPSSRGRTRSLSQTELAVRAVQRARPDMTASDALAAVNLARWS